MTSVRICCSSSCSTSGRITQEAFPPPASCRAARGSLAEPRQLRPHKLLHSQPPSAFSDSRCVSTQPLPVLSVQKSVHTCVATRASASEQHTSSSGNKKGFVWIVGAGLGTKEYLTVGIMHDAVLLCLVLEALAPPYL